MKHSIPDLEIEVTGDIARLEQGVMCGDESVVAVHRIQVAHLAEIMGIVKPRPDLEHVVDRMGDAIVDLRNGIARLARLLDSVPTFPPGRETEDVSMAFALLKTADLLCDRFSLCEPSDDQESPPQSIEHQAPERRQKNAELF